MASPACRRSGSTTSPTRRWRPGGGRCGSCAGATYIYRAPFQLCLRLTFPDTGAATTILYVLQPEDADSTRIYTRLLLSSGPGQPLPTPATVAAAVALEQRVLEEDRALQGVLATTGLPLDLRAELHLRSDRLGVALRRELCEFGAAAQVRRAA